MICILKRISLTRRVRSWPYQRKQWSSSCIPIWPINMDSELLWCSGQLLLSIQSKFICMKMLILLCLQRCSRMNVRKDSRSSRTIPVILLIRYSRRFIKRRIRTWKRETLREWWLRWRANHLMIQYGGRHWRDYLTEKHPRHWWNS